MTRLADEWVTSAAAQAVFDAIEDAGHKAYFVGGCVRNALLSVPVTDIDIATDAPPDAVTRAAEARDLKAVPTGVDHGTVTVLSQGIPYEVTTFRRDLATDGRRADVVFGTDLVEDARRRDFTMNALYATRSGEVVDPLGGLPDLDGRRVRFIGAARDRIREDYLRILRYFRFHAWYADSGAGFDPDALAAIAEEIDGLDVLSRERVGAEMIKLLAATDPAPELAVMERTGVLAHVLSGADPSAIAPLVHLEQVADIDPDAVRRLAVLGGESPKTSLRLSNADETRRAAIRDGLASEAGPGEIAYRRGADVARDVVLARAAMMGTPLPQEWETAVADGAAAELPVRAADLMPDLTGEALGRRLDELETRWIASGFRLTRDALLER